MTFCRARKLDRKTPRPSARKLAPDGAQKLTSSAALLRYRNSSICFMIADGESSTFTRRRHRPQNGRPTDWQSILSSDDPCLLSPLVSRRLELYQRPCKTPFLVLDLSQQGVDVHCFGEIFGNFPAECRTITFDPVRSRELRIRPNPGLDVGYPMHFRPYLYGRTASIGKPQKCRRQMGNNIARRYISKWR